MDGFIQATPSFEIERLGEKALLVRFGLDISRETHRRVMALDAILREKPFPGLIETVPSYGTLAVYYDPWRVYRIHGGRGDKLPFDRVSAYVRELLNGPEALALAFEPRLIEVPVCYGGELGPDLEEVAAVHGLTPEEAIRLHAGSVYEVYLIGFMPGFPYMGGLPEALATPRRATPRLQVPAGSVGIAGAQTGIYPLDSPGGWQLIGRSPLRLFRPEANPVSYLQAGDLVRFRAIGRAEFDALSEQAEGMG